jgi:hypothetical protein
VHPVSAFDSVTDTALLEELRDLAEDGTLSLHVADVMPASYAADSRPTASVAASSWTLRPR